MAGRGSTDLSLEDRLAIESLLKQKRRTGNIAQILVRSHSCIKQEIRKNGNKENYNAKEAHNAYLLRQAIRSKKLRKGLTESQVEIIKKGVAEGLSQNAIAKMASLTHFKIRQYFRENNITYYPKNYTGFEERISAIEEQIKLIFETIKEMQNDTKN